MLSVNANKFSAMCTALAVSGLVFYLISIFIINHPSCPASEFFSPLRLQWSSNQSEITDAHTNLSHIVFGLVGSAKAWRHRKYYIESWWRPNVTRGYLFLDKAPTNDLLPWSPASPPFRVSDDISKFLEECKHVAPVAARIVHAIAELFREDHEGGIRWYVMGDDDSILFIDNIVDVLSKYDHNKYIYVGGHAETILSDFYYSFNMGFGGAGLILSYPLAAAVAKDMANCLRRYSYFNAADLTLMSCVADFGYSLTAHAGLHQIDLRKDISGFLSSHALAPLLSLHHFDVVDPIFPSMNRADAVNHLMKAADIDQSRILQQTICYHRPSNWSFSIAWGYSVHIYENVIPRSILKKPLETFRPWVGKVKPPLFQFNTRWPNNDPCETPHVFFLNATEKTPKKEVLTSYVRAWPREIPACSFSGNHSADYISKIQIFTPASKLVEHDRSECCDIIYVGDTDMAQAKIRACMKDELIA